MSTNKVIYRRNVSFNERSFPARINNPSRTIAPRKVSHLIGQTFVDDGETFRVTNFSHHQGVDCLDYVNEKTNEEHYSTIEEIEQWVKQATILQLANEIQPTRKGFMNTLAEAMFHEIQHKIYKVKLNDPNTKPPKSFRDSQGRETQWFEAFKKERDVQSPKGGEIHATYLARYSWMIT